METRNERQTPWAATHPGTILKYELDERGIKQKDFATMIGMQKSHLNELIKGKRAMTQAVASKIESALGISAITLMSLQNNYDYDSKVIARRGVEEQEAMNTIMLYNDFIDVKTLLKRLGHEVSTAIQQVEYLAQELCLPQPAALKLEAAGMFKKSAKVGQDPRMLMTWKIIAEAKCNEQKVDAPFCKDNKDALLCELVSALHRNENTETNVKEILATYGIAFCIVPKVDKASVDGYSYFRNGHPHIALTKRYDRIDSFAFALMHEVGHIFLHYLEREQCVYRLSIPDYDNESREEREANAFAAKALIPDRVWGRAPEVRMNPVVIQSKYTEWAQAKGLNKWIALGRVAYETGMYKFRADEGRQIR